MLQGRSFAVTVEGGAGRRLATIHDLLAQISAEPGAPSLLFVPSLHDFAALTASIAGAARDCGDSATLSATAAFLKALQADLRGLLHCSAEQACRLYPLLSGVAQTQGEALLAALRQSRRPEGEGGEGDSGAGGSTTAACAVYAEAHTAGHLLKRLDDHAHSAAQPRTEGEAALVGVARLQNALPLLRPRVAASLGGSASEERCMRALQAAAHAEVHATDASLTTTESLLLRDDGGSHFVHERPMAVADAAATADKPSAIETFLSDMAQTVESWRTEGMGVEPVTPPFLPAASTDAEAVLLGDTPVHVHVRAADAPTLLEDARRLCARIEEDVRCVTRGLSALAAAAHAAEVPDGNLPAAGTYDSLKTAGATLVSLHSTLPSVSLEAVSASAQRLILAGLLSDATLTDLTSTATLSISSLQVQAVLLWWRTRLATRVSAVTADLPFLPGTDSLVSLEHFALQGFPFAALAPGFPGPQDATPFVGTLKHRATAFLEAAVDKLATSTSTRTSAVEVSAASVVQAITQRACLRAWAESEALRTAGKAAERRDAVRSLVRIAVFVFLWERRRAVDFVQAACTAAIRGHLGGSAGAAGVEKAREALVHARAAEAEANERLAASVLATEGDTAALEGAAREAQMAALHRQEVEDGVAVLEETEREKQQALRAPLESRRRAEMAALTAVQPPRAATTEGTVSAAAHATRAEDPWGFSEAAE